MSTPPSQRDAGPRAATPSGADAGEVLRWVLFAGSLLGLALLAAWTVRHPVLAVPGTGPVRDVRADASTDAPDDASPDASAVDLAVGPADAAPSVSVRPVETGPAAPVAAEGGASGEVRADAVPRPVPPSAPGPEAVTEAVTEDPAAGTSPEAPVTATTPEAPNAPVALAAAAGGGAAVEVRDGPVAAADATPATFAGTGPSDPDPDPEPDPEPPTADPASAEAEAAARVAARASDEEDAPFFATADGARDALGRAAGDGAATEGARLATAVPAPERGRSDAAERAAELSAAERRAEELAVLAGLSGRLRYAPGETFPGATGAEALERMVEPLTNHDDLDVVVSVTGREADDPARDASLARARAGRVIDRLVELGLDRGRFLLRLEPDVPGPTPGQHVRVSVIADAG